MMAAQANPQQAHYEQIHDAYGAHYYDPTSLEYRRRFIIAEFAKWVDFSGKRMADLACGEGHNSLLLKERFPSIQVEGFDISSSACADYRRVVGAPAHQIDLTTDIAVERTYQGAMVVGGLHHCVANLPKALENIAKLVEPGGKVVIFEPHAGFILEGLRNFWYRRDPYFEADTERALTPGELIKASGGRFREVASRPFGGPAYFLILNSMIMRVPLAAKGTLAPPLFAVEKAWNRLPGRALFPAFIAVWERV